MLKPQELSVVAKKLRPLLWVGVGTAGVALVLVGVGVAYTYFSGTTEALEPQAEEPAPDRYHQVTMEVDDPDPDATVGVAVQLFTSPVRPGSNATLQVRTLRSATCEISVEYGDIVSYDSGLAPKTADRFGMVSWTWTVEEYVPEGEWPVEVVCSWYEQSGMARPDLVVSWSADN